MKAFARISILSAFVLCYGLTAVAQDDWAKMSDQKKSSRPTAVKRSGPSAGELALRASEADGHAITKADTYIRKDATVYIDDMDGFEHYLAAALRKKTVPLIVVADPMLADYIIFGESQSKGAGWAKKFLLGDFRGTEMAGITMVDRRKKVVVFADSSHRGSANRGMRSTAEKLAKYLDRKITKDQKQMGRTD